MRAAAAIEIRPADVVRNAEGFVLRRPAPQLSLVLPSSAAQPLRMALPRPGFSVEIRAEDYTFDREGVLSQPFVVFEEVLPSTDVILLAARDRVEELRIVRSPSTRVTARYRLRLGAGVAEIRLRDGRVELVDATGYVGLSSDPMFAVDAHGQRRGLSVTLETSGRDALVSSTLDASGMTFPVAVDPVWTSVPSMVTARYGHGSAILPSGKVLIAGGGNAGSAFLSSAEIYDPATNTWSPGKAMLDGRNRHAMLPLSTGKVMAIAGQSAALGICATTELYDHVTDKWLTGATMAGARFVPGAVTLTDDRVLVGGGNPSGSTAEIYDPIKNVWSSAGTFAVGDRSNYAHVAQLAGGKALVTGDGSGGSTAEIWDPSTVKWSLVGSAPSPIVWVDAMLGGKVFGLSSTGKGAIYDPVASKWTATLGTSAVPRDDRRAYRLLGGRLLIVGGGTTAELYDPSTDAFFATDPMNVPRFFLPPPAVTILSSGAALVTGGVSGSLLALSAAELYRSEVGTACAKASECVSGYCVDGVCCDAACTDQCEACDVPKSLGKCMAIAGKPHGARPACVGSSDTCKDQRCDGVEKKTCTLPPAGTKCSFNACLLGFETHESSCDGKGTCGDTPKSCGTYSCGTSVCKTTCAADTDCAPGFYCKGGGPACAPIEGLGKACSSALACAKGLFCTDGFCCLVAACAPGASCGLSGAEGKCASPQGAKCGAASDCATGFCVDGVCCDTACDGQCEACDVPDATTGRSGRCTPIKGAPHGTRPKCASGSSDVCANATCDGAATKECKGFPGSDFECRPPSCKDGARVLRATCDGKGACPKTDGAPCGGYACNAAGTECKTRCDDLSDCSPDHVCKEEKCVPRAARCSDDGSQSIPATGAPVACSPFRCGTDGTCSKTCATALDCAPGFGCDPVAKACVPPESSTGDSGGCAIAAPRGSPSGQTLLLALAGWWASVQMLRARRRPRMGRRG